MPRYRFTTTNLTGHFPPPVPGLAVVEAGPWEGERDERLIYPGDLVETPERFPSPLFVDPTTGEPDVDGAEAVTAVDVVDVAAEPAMSVQWAEPDTASETFIPLAAPPDEPPAPPEPPKSRRAPQPHKE